MRRRNVLAALVATLVCAGITPAFAAHSACRLLSNPAGDATLAGNAPGDPGLDVVKATFQTADGHLIVRVTVVDLSAVAANDRAWMVHLTVNEQQYSLVAERHVDGDVFVATARAASAGATVDRNLGRIAGKITPSANEVLLDVPLSLLSAREGSRAYSIDVDTFADTGASGSTARMGNPDDPYGSVGVYEDAAKGDREYRMRPTC